jgi:superfamily I DNA and/or RNA helicase
MAAAILAAGAPLLLVLHDEDRSQQRNELEAEIVMRLIRLAVNLDAPPSFGVVVPHTAQRADLRARLLEETGDELIAAGVDTVERFQGEERDLVVFAATESDPAYIRAMGTFLFDPRRLTVAISRGKGKMIVIAARSVFEYLPVDQKDVDDLAMWRELADRTCTVPVWEGVIDGHEVSVTGSTPLDADL